MVFDFHLFYRKIWYYYLIVICFIFSGKPYGDDNNDLYNNEDYTDPSNPPADDPADEPIYKLPKFVTKSQNLMVNEGSTIRLPCVVDRLGKKTCY